MGKYSFTREDLKIYTVSQLKRLCSYYDIKVSSSWSKSRIIQAILDNIPVSYGIQGENNPKVATKSVRVARIENQMKGFDHE